MASISEGMLGHVSRCVRSSEVWSSLEVSFRTNSKARVLQLRFLLQTTKKGSLSVEEFILKMRGFADDLNSVGQYISDTRIVHSWWSRNGI